MSEATGIRIDLRDVSLDVGGEPALRGFTASFEPGTFTALVGGDGAGKTTLLSTLAHRRGRALLGIEGLTPRDVGFQPATSGVWPNLSVEENLRFVADAQGLRGPETSARIDELIGLADLDRARKRIGARLSGGMRQKLGAAMAMLHRPALLLLDEPTTGVDPDSREILGRLIRGAADEGATVLVATTYLDEAEAADRAPLLDGGRILAQGEPAEVVALAPGSLWSAPAGAVNLTAPDSLEIGEAAPATPDLELATIEFLLDSRTPDVPSGEAARSLPSPGTGPALVRPKHRAEPEALIACREIVKTFGDFRALDGVDLDVRPGEVVGLVGGNGAGKSTLIRLILGVDAPDTGEIALFGARPSRRSRARLGYVSQALGLYPTLATQENLDFTQDVFGVPAEERIRLDAGRAPVGDLPLGARRTLAVDCALSHSPELLVLDEPTSGMDSLGRARLWKRIRRASSAGTGVLVTTHYQQEAAQCDVLVRLEAGRVVETRRN
ncbi:ATP-binding cassette domain-containing protein [Actinomyces culturomici]|uniref:ATP-binding cassette domain-containing protein n=1 Tax=Actinomyces culturomici TaxID=1926276 RepID=UPI000E206704|nr:ATP-binding cassette domain-containing protein [Actinomyces culturomici]